MDSLDDNSPVPYLIGTGLGDTGAQLVRLTGAQLVRLTVFNDTVKVSLSFSAAS